MGLLFLSSLPSLTRKQAGNSNKGKTLTYARSRAWIQGSMAVDHRNEIVMVMMQQHFMMRSKRHTTHLRHRGRHRWRMTVVAAAPRRHHLHHLFAVYRVNPWRPWR